MIGTTACPICKVRVPVSIAHTARHGDGTYSVQLDWVEVEAHLLAHQPERSCDCDPDWTHHMCEEHP